MDRHISGRDIARDGLPGRIAEIAPEFLLRLGIRLRMDGPPREQAEAEAANQPAHPLDGVVHAEESRDPLPQIAERPASGLAGIRIGAGIDYQCDRPHAVARVAESVPPGHLP